MWKSKFKTLFFIKIKIINKIINEYLKYTGKCICKKFVQGIYCNECTEGYFNLTKENSNGCSLCDCNSEGTLSNADTNLNLCDKTTGKCLCKTNYVQGSKCDRCMNSMYNLENGCIDLCNCDPYGSQSPTCDQTSGQCKCNRIFFY